ncbi:MAG: hypothetical protein ACFFG0_51535 [Candidatus Thorarchaeota archaeon]
MEIKELSRLEVASELVKKHEKALAVTQEEFQKYQTMEAELDKIAETAKVERDKINDQVKQLKDTRQTLYSESKDLRNAFMNQTKKKESMKNIPMEVLILTKQIDQFEWEIQTEAVKVDEEKKLLKRIQDNLDKLHNYANMYKEHEDISNAVRQLTSKLRRTLRKAEAAHQDMLGKVESSDDFHKKFVDAVMKLRDARTKRVGFQREVEKHKKALEHWQNVVAKESRKVKSSDPKNNKATNIEKDKKEQEKKKIESPNKDAKSTESGRTKKDGQ